MSDAMDEKSTSTGEWDKLLSYIEFRRASEGLWINSDPKFWFNVITNDTGRIRTEVHQDSGGGPVESFSISARYFVSGKETVYSTRLVYADGFPLGNVFADRMAAVYRYMSSYAGRTLYEQANWPYNDPDAGAGDGDGVDRALWVKTFGALTKIGELNKDELTLTKQVYGNHDLCHGVHLLQRVAWIRGVYLRGEAARCVNVAKRWALLMLLEMQRYYYTSC